MSAAETQAEAAVATTTAPAVLAGPHTGAEFGTFGVTCDKTEGDTWSSSATSYTDDADGAVPIWKLTS